MTIYTISDAINLPIDFSILSATNNAYINNSNNNTILNTIALIAIFIIIFIICIACWISTKEKK